MQLRVTTPRQLIPAAIICPMILGWIAQEGESLGFYHDPVGLTVMTVVMILVLLTVIAVGVGSIDASERRRVSAEHLLRESEMDYRDLFESGGVGICRTSADGRILKANDAFAHILGYADQAALLSVRAQDLYANPADRVMVTAAIEANGYAVTEVEFRRADGTVLWVENHARIMDGDGRDGARYEGALIDISQRKRLELQFLQAQKMEAVGRLAGGVAHDFNNLLTVIRSYCDLILLDLPNDLPVRGDIGEISQAADRAAALARQLLTFSRRQVLHLQVLNANTSVQQLDGMLRRLLPSSVHCRAQLGADLGSIRADSGHIDQLLMNLAINGSDAMPDGGELKIETSNATLSHAYAELHTGVVAGEYVLITVSDSGTGMDKETLSHIFEPFFTTKAVGKGTGLGLATVFGIVEQNHGHVCVDSELGKGTTFKIYFPRVAEAPLVTVVPSPCEAAGKNGVSRTVLVVEDDDSVRGTIVKVLERQKYQVLQAAHGQEGLRVSADFQGKIDLVISDVMMPVLGGREFVERLVAARSESRILLTSGYTDDHVLKHGQTDPAFEVLEKPFTVAELVAKVEEVLA